MTYKLWCVGIVLLVLVLPAPAEEPAPGDAWLGVWLVDAVDGGVEVVALVPGGPASRADLQIGDVIVRANRESVHGRPAIGRLIRELAPGDAVELALFRAGQALDARVELGSRVVAAPALAAVPRIPTPATSSAPQPPRYRLELSPGAHGAGLRLAEMTPALREHYGAPPATGVLVTRVESDGPAAAIEVGDVVLEIGERPVSTAAQLVRELARWSGNRPLSVAVVRGGEQRLLSLPLSTRVGPSGSSANRRALMQRRLELERERLQRRLAELERELQQLARSSR